MTSGRSKKAPAKSWWERWPDLLQQELGAFERQNAPCQIVRRGGGVIELSVKWPFGNGRVVDLSVAYSPLHPFMRPTVKAPDQDLVRHQNPFGGELCLLTQDSGQWDSNQLVADLLAEQIPTLFAAVQARAAGNLEDAAKFEEQAADSTSAYFAPLYDNGCVVLFDGRLPTPGHNVGLAKFKTWARLRWQQDEATESVLHEMSSAEGKPFHHFDLPLNPQSAVIIPGRWVRLRPPFTVDPDELLVAANRKIEELGVLEPKAATAFRRVAEEPSFFTAMVFDEEVEYRKRAAGCLFVRSTRDIRQRAILRSILVRGERTSEADVFARLPVARVLQQNSALVVGCGAIGSFVALELARAGIGKLRLIDRDHVQPGNSLRWPLGRAAWGCEKTFALRDFIQRNYPFTKVDVIAARLGSLDFGRPDELRDLIEGAGVVVDASASSELQAALSYYCRLYGRPYVMGNASEGVAGGIVARFRPGQRGCWACLQDQLNSGKIVLEEDRSGTVTPVGCSAPTFTGASFDLQEVSMEMVRSAVGVLAEKMYDGGSWRLAVLRLRSEKGERILPEWTKYELEVRPGCECDSR